MAKVIREITNVHRCRMSNSPSNKKKADFANYLH